MLLRGKAGPCRDVVNLSVRIHQKFARQLDATLDDVFVDGLPGPALELLPKSRDRRPDGPRQIGDAQGDGEILLDIGHKLGYLAIRQRSSLGAWSQGANAAHRFGKGEVPQRLDCERIGAVAMGHCATGVGNKIGYCRRNDVVDAVVGASDQSVVAIHFLAKRRGIRKGNKATADLVSANCDFAVARMKRDGEWPEPHSDGPSAIISRLRVDRAEQQTDDVRAISKG